MQAALSGYGWGFNNTLFNVSLGLPNYLTNFSSKFIARLQRLDELLSQDDPPHPLYAKTSPGMQTDGFLFQPVPAPWGFVTSGYAIGLLAVVSLFVVVHPGHVDRSFPRLFC